MRRLTDRDRGLGIRRLMPPYPYPAQHFPHGYKYNPFHGYRWGQGPSQGSGSLHSPGLNFGWRIKKSLLAPVVVAMVCGEE